MIYLVLSHSMDSQQTAHDRLGALTPQRALELAGRLRPGMIPVAAYTAAELVLMARSLETATPAELARELAALEAGH